MTLSVPRPAKPDYTAVFIEPAYPEGDPYADLDQEDEEIPLAVVNNRSQRGVTAPGRPRRA